MEQVHRDLKVLKAFDYIFIIVALVIMGGMFYIGIQTSALPGILQHIDQIVVRLDNHEGRLSKIENWHN